MEWLLLMLRNKTGFAVEKVPEAISTTKRWVPFFTLNTRAEFVIYATAFQGETVVKIILPIFYPGLQWFVLNPILNQLMKGATQNTYRIQVALCFFLDLNPTRLL